MSESFTGCSADLREQMRIGVHTLSSQIEAISVAANVAAVEMGDFVVNPLNSWPKKGEK